MALVNGLQRVVQWARSESIHYYHVHIGCCANEIFGAFGARYDLERLGCRPQSQPQLADLLIVSGTVTKALENELKQLVQQIQAPRYVMAVGTCAISGNVFCSKNSSDVVPLDSLMKVDVFVPGCPPRPEAIMDGLLSIKEKVRAAK